MAGTKAGGEAAARTNKAKYGDDFYKKIGHRGGLKGHTGGFAANRALARIAGAKGGRISRRTKSELSRCVKGHLQSALTVTANGQCRKCIQHNLDIAHRQAEAARSKMSFKDYDTEAA